MKNSFSILVAVLLGGLPALAQMDSGASPGANFDNGMEKLFGATPVFSATMQTRMDSPDGPVTVKTKFYFDHESSRTEMNMADAHGGSLPPDAPEQMKALGMDQVVTITPADKKSVCMIYPNIHSYVDMQIPGSGPDTNQYQIQTTKVGEETVDGHPCVKNKTIVWTDDQTNEFTVWNASDLKNFPVQIAMSEGDMSATIDFHNVSFDKLDAGLFQAPTNYTRYGTMQDLMMSAAMNHPGGMPGMPGSSGMPAPSVSTTPNQ